MRGDAQRVAGGSPSSERLQSRLTDLYNEYGDAFINRLYYGDRLAKVKRWNLALEAAIAIGTSSAVGAWAIWRQDGGEAAWAVLAGIATVLAILKPILQLPKQIERYSRLFSGHGAACEDLESLVKTVRTARSYPKQVDDRRREIHERVKKLAEDDDPVFNRKLIAKVSREVLRDRPRSYFWWPQPTSGEVDHEKRQNHDSEHEETESASERRRGARGGQ